MFNFKMTPVAAAELTADAALPIWVVIKLKGSAEPFLSYCSSFMANSS